MISDYESAGGAAIAASRLATGLVDQGHVVTRIVGEPDGADHPWETRPIAWPRAALKFARVLEPRAVGGRWLELPTRHRLSRELSRFRPDIINLHNLHGMGPSGWTPSLLEGTTSTPVVWTLHDMWSFTGRCAYSGTCTKFIRGCDATCPTPEDYPALAPDQIEGAWRRRAPVTAGATAVAPSRWLERLARSGMWGSSRVEHIPYGVPLDLYRPGPSTSARSQLGIDGRTPVILVSAVNLHDPRKGVDLLGGALRQLSREITVLAMGGGQLPAWPSHVRVRSLGHLADPARKSIAYAAADVLVHPAREDNLPLVVLEAIACGTPVVGFDIGGMRDAVRVDVSGWLTSTVSADSLAGAVSEALDDPQRARLRQSCRALAEAEYSQVREAQRYGDLFKDLVNGRVGA